jgi:autotransporter-associated beta strand protein
VEVLEIRVTPAGSSVWMGTVSDLWSVDGNWDEAPEMGNDLKFPGGASNTMNTNDLTAGMSFNSLTISADGYTLKGNGIALANNIDASASSGLDTVNLPLDLTGTGAVNVDRSATTLVLGGEITGTTGLTKGGAGILDLMGPNTYSGTTAVNQGTLYVNTTQPGSPVTVSAGATLGGTGTVGGITTSAGTVSPGTSVTAILTDTGALTMGPAATFNVALNGLSPGAGYSQLSVADQVTLNGATLVATAVPEATGNHQYTIIDNTGTGAISGTFAGLPEGSQLMISGMPFRITYQGGPSNNDVVLTSLVGSTTSVTPSSTSITYGSPISLTATVASADSTFTATPSGTVNFFNGMTPLGPATLSGGSATLDNVILPGGTNSDITAVYQGDDSFASSSSPAATPVMVAQAGTNTGVSVTPSTLKSGQSVLLSASVSPQSPGGVLPTGNVEFFSGSPATGRLLGTAALQAGVASMNTTMLKTADTEVTAAYQGDGNYLSSDSTATPVVVTAASTMTALTISPNPSGLGNPVTLTAVVSVSSPGTGTPTGTVQFMNGTTPIGSPVPLSGNTASTMTSSLPMGANTLTAVYSGDDNFEMSTSPQMTATVLNASSTTVTPSLSTIVFGQPISLSATVTASSSSVTLTPTGNVQFFNGSTSLGTAALNGSGTAMLPNVSLPTGMPSITAEYAGDSNFASSTSAGVTVTVNQANTTTTITSITPNPSGLGQTTTITAMVAPLSPGAGTITGSIEFLSGTTMLGMGTISSGVATLPTAALPLGANSITAKYEGDTNFMTSTSPAVTATVNQASTTTLMAAPTTAVTGQQVTLTATVAASSGTGTPTGTVQFFNGSTLLGTGTLNSSGEATTQTMSLTAGMPSLTAVYGGDSTFAGSTSTAVTVTVNKSDTNTAVNVVPNPSNSGATVTLTATVTAASPGSGTPTGTVNFLNGSTSLGTATLLSNGTASTTSSALTVGTNSITAVYEGDTNYNSSTSSVFTQTVLPATTTTVAASPSPAVVGQPVTLTAGVSSTAGVPAGTVQFFSGSTSLGTATLSNGVGSIVTTAIPFGFNTITARYQGSSSFSPSTSTGISVTIQQASTTTSLVASPTTATLGQTVTLTATVHPAPPSTGGPTPTGSITFMDGTNFLGTATLTNAVATFTTSSLTTGTHSITAIYINDGNYSSSTSPAVSVVITTSAPSISLGISNGNPVSNEAVVFLASVAAVSPTTGTPTGTVDFFSNGTMFGSGTLTNGQASTTFSGLALGNQTITAVYQGDSNFAGNIATAPRVIKVGDGNQLYVNQVYVQAALRIADPTGLANYWTLLANGSTRKYVVRSIVFNEGLQHDNKLEKNVVGSKFSAHQSASVRVVHVYEALFNRQPTSKELKAGVAQVSRSGNATMLIIDLMSSMAYFLNAFKLGTAGGIANVAPVVPGRVS